MSNEESTMNTPGGPRGTHPLNISHLVLGLVFLGMTAVWAANAAGWVSGGGYRWLLPGTLVAAGAIGLLAVALRSRSTPAHDLPSAGPSGRSSDTRESYETYDQGDQDR